MKQASDVEESSTVAMLIVNWLGEILRSVTSSLPARREEGARDQQTQLQRHQQGKKNRRAKRKAERDNSLVGGLQRERLQEHRQIHGQEE